MSKEKQIDEMAKIIHGYCEAPCCGGCDYCLEYLKAESIYNAGYRKQKEGEWIFEHEFYGKMLCSNCKEEALVNECNEYVDSDFCPHCGARMKGGAK